VIDADNNLSVKGSGAAPTVAALAGIGTGGTVTLAGTDHAGVITLTTGTGTPGGGDILRVTFNTAKSAIPVVIVQLTADGSFSLLPIRPYSFSTTKFDIYFDAAPAASTVYKFNYVTFNRS